MMNRKIAVVVWINESQQLTDAGKENIQKTIQSVKSKADSIKVFSNISGLTFEDVDSVEVLDPELTEVKFLNSVIDSYRKEGYQGYLHIINYAVEVLKDPEQFITDIENMMDVLNINSWLGTATDTCNYLYKKYVPRLSVVIDDKMKEWSEKLKIDKVLFCSHSNVHWMIFNLGKADEGECKFNDSFIIPMYWIIEYLARRRNSHPNTLYFMNEYITCSSELGVYKLFDGSIKSDEEVLKSKGIDKVEYIKKMNENAKNDDEMFRSLKVDHHPDNNLDVVLERTYLTLKEKFDKIS